MSSYMYCGEKDTVEVRKALNDLERHKMIKKLLADILIDMTVCKLEGWDVLEYPRMIQEEMNRIITRSRR